MVLLRRPPRPAAAGAPAVALPLRLHAEAVEELLERLPPVLGPPRLDPCHVRAAEPGALLALGLLARSHGVDPPALPVPADALLPPLRLADVPGTRWLLETLGGTSFCARLSALGWTEGDARRLVAAAGELARNAVEHAGAPAWMAAWRTAGEVRLAVADAGVGFAASLGLPGEREGLLRAVMHGTGLRRVGALVAAWGGTMRVRSRTVLLCGSPPWQGAAVRDQLPFLPGVQVEIAVPAVRG